MATSRLDSEGSTDATSNFGGQEFGEFSEITASIDPDSPSIVILTANKAGVPFTATSGETTAGTGTAALTNIQVATGPWHWDNAKNWSGGAVPANDDVCVLKDQIGPSVGFKYGLPNASKEVTIQHWMSYTGQIGLPPVNAESASKSYPEYRQQYVRLDDAGGGTDIAHRFGLGKDGIGSPMINLKHSTVKCSPIVYNTGASQLQGRKSLNLCCTTNTSTLKIFGGSVDFSSQDGSTSAFVTVTQHGGDSRGVTAIHTVAGTFVLSGGTALIGGTAAIFAIEARAGTLRVENQTATVTGAVTFAGGTIDWASSGTITGATGFGGTFDFRNCPGCTITTLNLYRESKFIDPFAAVTIGSNGYVYYDPTDGLVTGSSETTTRLRIV